jgi:hypothetical protein
MLLSMAWSIRALKSMLAAQWMTTLQFSIRSASVSLDNPSPSLRRSPWLTIISYTWVSPCQWWTNQTFPYGLDEVCRSKRCWWSPFWIVLADLILLCLWWEHKSYPHSSERTSIFLEAPCQGSRWFPWSVCVCLRIFRRLTFNTL